MGVLIRVSHHQSRRVRNDAWRVGSQTLVHAGPMRCVRDLGHGGHTNSLSKKVRLQVDKARWSGLAGRNL